jgi:hypothetical protein
MKGIVLDRIEESSAKCFLVKVKLRDYIQGLPSDFKQYDIQREVVSNVYLDNLIQTILEQKHIPSLVLVSDDTDLHLKDNEFEVDTFKILDGLQRTVRLKSIYETLLLFDYERSVSTEILGLSKIQISKKYKTQLESKGSSSLLLNRIIEYFKNDARAHSIDQSETLFDRYQWFEIWTGLSPKQEVEKMLVLNAGHKPVKTKHQLELLFRNIIPILKKIDYDEFSIVREKETQSTFSKERKVGQFHFASLITSLLSFSEGRPLTSNIDLIQRKQSESFDDKIFDRLLQFSFLNEFVNTLLKIDKQLASHYGNDGTKWFGRETTLVGIFAAAGKKAKEQGDVPENILHQLRNKILLNPEILALGEFERVRNSQDLGKINIGTINKRAVYNGILDILGGKSDVILWADYFKKEDDR